MNRVMIVAVLMAAILIRLIRPSSISWFNNYLCRVDADSVSDAVFKELGITTKITKTCIPSPSKNFPGGVQSNRCYFTYVPDCATSDTPIVVEVHGAIWCPSAIIKRTGWTKLAEEQCFILAWPVGVTDYNYASLTCFAVPGGLELNNELLEASPCCCQDVSQLIRGGCRDHKLFQDPRFIRNMVANIADKVPLETNNRVTVDIKRVYVTGVSNGCMMSLAMAVLHSDMVAAACCQGGSLLTPLPSSYDPVAIWTAHGRNDRFIPYEGGLGLAKARLLGQQDQFSLLSAANGCNQSEVFEEPVFDENGRLSGIVETRAGCKNGANVSLATIANSGHAVVQGQATNVDTTTLAWKFCSKFSKRIKPDLRSDVPLLTETTSPGFFESIWFFLLGCLPFDPYFWLVA